MRAKLANENHSAVPFLSRADINLCWYYITCKFMQTVVQDIFVACNALTLKVVFDNRDISSIVIFQCDNVHFNSVINRYF